MENLMLKMRIVLLKNHFMILLPSEIPFLHKIYRPLMPYLILPAMLAPLFVPWQ